MPMTRKKPLGEAEQGDHGIVRELAALRHANEQMTKGLQQLLEVGATHTALLEAVLDAATVSVEPDGALETTLAQIRDAILRQNHVLTEIRHVLVASSK